MKITLNNSIYNHNKVFNKKEEVIFEGDFQELIDFLLVKFDYTLTENEDMSLYEEFGDRDFKVISNVEFPQKMIDEVVKLAEHSIKREDTYEEVFKDFSMKDILELISSRKILEFQKLYEDKGLSYEDEDDFIDEIKSSTYKKYKEISIPLTFPPKIMNNLNREDFMFTSELYAVEDGNDYYILELMLGMGYPLYKFYNILDSDMSKENWLETIDYSKKLNDLNSQYS